MVVVVTVDGRTRDALGYGGVGVSWVTVATRMSRAARIILASNLRKVSMSMFLVIRGWK